VRAIRTVTVTRYVTPLREGGSLPAIVEADDDGLYVLKFRGAGHGVHALIAELVSGEIGRAVGLPVPEIVFAAVDPDLARTEPDPEIHALIHDSAGLNVALDYLPGAVNFDPVVHTLTAELASRIVWFDALVTNVDRTPRNTNMLMWHRAPWLIDHGSTLYFHHSAGWETQTGRARAPFPAIKSHVLLRYATKVQEQDAAMASALTADVIAEILALVPDDWIHDRAIGADSGDLRAAYGRYVLERLAAPRSFVEEAVRAR
jgi:HipA-like protein